MGKKSAAATGGDDGGVEDLLEGKPKGKSKTPKEAAPDAAPAAAKKGKKAAAEPAPEAAPAKKGKKAAKEAEAEKTGTRGEVVRFAEGERQALYDGVTGHFKKSKKPIASKDLAEKLGVSTKKLRPVLYSLAKREAAPIVLSLDGSRVGGMTISPA